MKHLNLKEGCYVYILKDFLNPKEKKFFNKQCSLIENWRGGMTSFGNKVRRKQLYFQDEKIYFSPTWKTRYPRWEANPYPLWLRYLHLKVNNYLKSNGFTLDGLDSALINYYLNGSESIRAHRDNQPIWGNNPVISSLSFGSPRDFFLKRIIHDPTNPKSMKLDNSEKETIIKLEEGDLLVMAGDTQKNYCHGINRTNVPVGPRYNISFRKLEPNFID